MAQRDYVSRGRSTARRRKSSGKRNASSVSKTMMVLAIAVLTTFAGGLYFIVHNQPGEALLPSGNHPQLGNGLPPKPEERWSYIKELENRQVGVAQPTQPYTGNEIGSSQHLSAEQRSLLEQMQADMRQQPTALAEVPSTPAAAPPYMETPRSTVVNVTPPPQAAQAPRTPTTPVPAPAPQTAPASKKVEQKAIDRWTLQCGSFRNADQAEATRAQLAFSGIEGRLVSAGGWHRVVLGPYNSRSSADKILQQVKQSGSSGCILLGVSN